MIDPGAVADLIIVDGDPSRRSSLLSRPVDSLKAVIRDGVFVIDRISAIAPWKSGTRCHTS